MEEFSRSAALGWIQGGGHTGKKAGLDNMYALLAALNHPEASFPAMHVAGTNGKGSTCAILERILRESGKTTGLYTSPYLCRYNERVRVNGIPIPDDRLLSYIALLRKTSQDLEQRGVFPTPFELGTALAYLYFRDEQVDIAVIEVGLGGRLDSTNTLLPAVSVIAAIGLDHTKTLGDTIEKIAWEKAGIIKPGVPAVVMPQSERVMGVFRDVAKDRKSPLVVAATPSIQAESRYGCRFFLSLPNAGEQEFVLNLAGDHQAANASLALTALDVMGVSRTAMLNGLPKATWPGRLEWIGGVLLDGAHNPQGAASLKRFLMSRFPMEKITLVTGMMKDKEYLRCAEILAPLCKKVYATAVDDARAASPEEIAKTYAGFGVETSVIPHAQEAICAAKRERGLVVISGSLYLVGAAREFLHPDDGSI